MRDLYIKKTETRREKEYQNLKKVFKLEECFDRPTDGGRVIKKQVKMTIPSGLKWRTFAEDIIAKGTSYNIFGEYPDSGEGSNPREVILHFNAYPGKNISFGVKIWNNKNENIEGDWSIIIKT